MQVHNLTQGTDQWRAHRFNFLNASDAPAMMACSPHMTRTDLVKQLALGIERDFSDYVQRRILDKGHQFEALARPMAEKIMGEDLAPLVGTSGKYGASYDGQTMLGDRSWEHKRLNAALREAMFEGCTGADLPLCYQVQMEHQAMVADGTEQILFTASEWDDDDNIIEARHCWYTPNPTLRAQIVAGWAQLEADVAEYVLPAAVAPAPTGKAPASLPALLVELKGEVTASNLAEFKEVALTAIRSVNRDLKTDQDFADSAKARKWCEDIESRVAITKEHALAQTATIKELFDALDEISAEARNVRLDLQKIEKARADAINGELVADGIAKFSAHIDKLNATMPAAYMPKIAADFGGALRNLRSVSSKQNAINTALANAKIEADEVARRIQANLRILAETPDMAFLFNDVANIVLKANDDFAVLVKSRIAEHEAKEAARVAADKEKLRVQAEAQATAKVAEHNRMLMSEISGIQQQVAIAQVGRAGVRKGGTIECIRETLAETEAWVIDAEHFGAMAGLAQSAKETAVAQIKSLLDAATALEQAVHTGASAQAEIAEASAPQAITTAQRTAASSPAVVPLRAAPAPAAAPATAASLKLGTITERLGFALTADFMANTLGFAPAATDRASKLYHEADFPHICAALVRHVESVQAKAAA